jgi:alcohol dehydrogenase
MLAFPTSSVAPFSTEKIPRVIFGAGAVSRLFDEISALGDHVLLVTGAGSFRSKPEWAQLLEQLDGAGMACVDIAIAGEPTVDEIDGHVSALQATPVDIVVAIGGGSVLDAGKAIAGLVPSGRSVMDFLEGVGLGLPFEGPVLRLIAVPTTAGTGSEVTKNAVLSSKDADHPFKKSFRDSRLIPELAIVDPALLSSCSYQGIAAQGMDAFTQLIEAYVSGGSNPLTDALSWSGLQAFQRGFLPALTGDANGQSLMAYAALMSGIALAQAGLGAVHGLASPLGARFPVSHGVVCGTLVGETTRVNIAALIDRGESETALAKYANVGRLLAQNDSMSRGDALATLLSKLEEWIASLPLSRLSEVGVTEADLDIIIAECRGSSMRTNPIELTDDEIREILTSRL